MHEQTRKFIYLMFFYLLGPILTLGILGGVVLRKLPSNASKLEYELTKQTGIRWTIQKVEYRTPFLTRLKKVRVWDDAANNSVFFAPVIDIQKCSADNRDLTKIFPNVNAAVNRRLNGYYQITVPASLLTLEKYPPEQAEIVVKKILSRMFDRLPFLSEMPVLFAFKDLGVSGSIKKPDEKPFHFRDIRGNLYRTETDIRSDWAFQLPGISDLEMQKISVVKQWTGGGFGFVLRTGKRTIPCELAGVFSTAFRQLGTGSRFSGEFSMENGEWKMENVVFKNIALAPLLKQYSPFAVTGTVTDFQIHNAVFGGGTVAAEGCTQIAGGSIDKTLFHRLLDQFRLAVNPPEVADTLSDVVPFDGCAVHFKLRNNGIEFRGDKLWENGKLLMYREGDNLRTQPMYILLPQEKSPPVPYYAVLSLFAPDNAPVFPLTPGLKKIIGAVPVENQR
ncbi:MAG: hypothetical protein LBN39_08090 [Planctomycetaceae bacterium]|jgi:hypothetical protein|nr:hypothetical protein [Planctomycetaceae bacterium]